MGKNTCKLHHAQSLVQRTTVLAAEDSSFCTGRTAVLGLEDWIRTGGKAKTCAPGGYVVALSFIEFRYKFIVFR